MLSTPRTYAVSDEAELPVNRRIGPRLHISVDNVPIRWVVSYDVDAGEVVRLAVDRDGRTLRNPTQRDEWLFQTVRGRVEVTWAEAGDAQN